MLLLEVHFSVSARILGSELYLRNDFPLLFMSPPPPQLAEVKVRIMEAKQTLEDCITAQEFNRAADIKNSIAEFENRRNQIIQEIAESSQPADKDIRTEKVHNNTGSTTAVSSIIQYNVPCIVQRFFLLESESKVKGLTSLVSFQNDPETLLRCLTMCAELLKQMSIKTRIGPTISALMSSLVGTYTAHIICLTSADQEIIEIAISSFFDTGKMCHNIQLLREALGSNPEAKHLKKNIVVPVKFKMQI